MADWLQNVVKIQTSNEEFYRLFRQALEDMAALRLPIAGTDHMVFLPAAGLPWFVAPFGRDSLIVSLQNTLIYPEFARGALEVLGSLQAKEEDDYRDAEPGKILHEIRYGELAHFKLIPHTPYYGTADATPLYLITLHSAWRATGDRSSWSGISRLQKDACPGSTNMATATATVSRNTRRALRSATRTWAGRIRVIPLSIPDGSLVKGPKALCELQGYVYDAWVRMAEVFDALGKPDRAQALRAKAGCAVRPLQRSLLGRRTRLLCLCARWREEEGADRRIQRRTLPLVRHRASRARQESGGTPDGAGHVDRMGHSHAFRQSPGVQSVQLSDGFGLAARQRDHRDGLQILWLRRGGGADRARHQRCSRATSGSTSCRSCTPHSSAKRPTFPVQYIGANVPQAWAAGSAFMLTQALLGFLPDAPRNKLYIDPSLPRWLPDLTVHDLRVGKHKLDIRFWREGEETAFEVIKGDPSLVERCDPGIQGRAAENRVRCTLADGNPDLETWRPAPSAGDRISAKLFGTQQSRPRAADRYGVDR